MPKSDDPTDDPLQMQSVDGIPPIHRISVISVGPGHADHVTGAARRAAASCDVLIGSKDQLEAVGARDDQVLYDEWGVEKIFARLDENRGRPTGVLVTGDAGIFSLAGRIGDRYGREAIREIVPGVSSLQLAFARIRESWLNVQAFTYRERPFEKITEVLSCSRAAVFCDRRHTASVVLRHLAGEGLFDGERRVVLCQNLSYDDEKVLELRSEREIDAIETRRFEIVIVLSGKRE